MGYSGELSVSMVLAHTFTGYIFSKNELSEILLPLDLSDMLLIRSHQMRVVLSLICPKNSKEIIRCVSFKLLVQFCFVC